jgi:hypothetical protein
VFRFFAKAICETRFRILEFLNCFANSILILIFQFSKISALVIIHWDYLLLTGFHYTLSLLFLFRYVQTANKYMRVFSSLYYYLAGYLVYQTFILTLQLLAYDVDIKLGDTENVTHQIYFSDPEASISLTFIVSFLLGM